MANITKVRGKLRANKTITQSGVGKKSVKLSVNRNTKIRIKKA
jgi:hypothetical protein